jgi:hypothetical protein
MKTALSLCLALVALAPAHAQIFRPAAVNGALLGGLAGAIIGNNSGSLHHNAWQGAAIGAGTGLLLGAALDDGRYDGTYVYRTSPPVYRYPAYRYPASRYPYYASGYGYYGRYYGRPDYRGSGVLLGGITGAIIGNNSRGFHHNAWRGAAWGAGLGYIFGSIAEDNARYREAVVERPPVYVQAAPAPAASQPQNVTIINNYYNTPATPMSSANGLFGRN